MVCYEREIILQNHQWAVDSDGVTTVGDNVKYEFSAHQLSETRKGIKCVYYKWPLQLAEKTWIDIEAFIEMFERALTIHAGKYKPPFDRAMFERTVALARERVGRRARAT